MNDDEKTIACHECIGRRLGASFDRTTPILDFGCGAGARVRAYRARGYQAYGYDIVDRSPDQRNSRLDWFRFQQGHADARNSRLGGTFRLPFDDGFFGFAFSETTLEHVMDYDPALSEISRVLRDGAFSLHTFPPRYVPVEPHVGAPLASVFRSYPYLLFWARLGVLKRAPGESAEQAARHQQEYLENHTNYISKSKVRAAAAPYFRQIEFIDELFYGCWPGRSRVLSPLFRLLPPLRWLHGELRMRILLLQK